MQKITEAQFNEFVSHDMRELFELFANASVYFEAILTQNDGVTTPVAKISHFGEVDYLHNASCYFEHDGESYAYKSLESQFKIEYFSYANIADCRAHMLSVLNSVEFDTYV